jgi:hypothetical protein
MVDERLMGREGQERVLILLALLGTCRVAVPARDFVRASSR